MTHIFHVSCCIFNRLNLCYCAIDWRWLFKRLSFLSYRDWHFFFIVIRQVFLCCRIVESWRNIPKPFFWLFSVPVKARMDISFWPVKCCLAKTSSLVNACLKKVGHVSVLLVVRFSCHYIRCLFVVIREALSSSSSNWCHPRWFSRVKNIRISSTRYAFFKGLFLSFVSPCYW